MDLYLFKLFEFTVTHIIYTNLLNKFSVNYHMETLQNNQNNKITKKISGRKELDTQKIKRATQDALRFIGEQENKRTQENKL